MELKQVCGRHKPSMCVCVCVTFCLLCVIIVLPSLCSCYGSVVCSRYEPPLRTDYRIPVENISSRVSWLAGTVDNASVIACSVHVSA